MTRSSSPGHLLVIRSGLCSSARVFSRRPMLRVLVIEDESRIRAFLARALEADGFAVDGADNGPDGQFRLLHHLVKHAGEVVTRDSILSAVWGYHFDPRSNVVDVCVRRLRRKLGEEAPIQTVRHAGYRLTTA